MAKASMPNSCFAERMEEGVQERLSQIQRVYKNEGPSNGLMGWLVVLPFVMR